MKQVLITTEHRGVFAGEISEKQDLKATSMPMKNAKMAIYWGTTLGVIELAEIGPNKKSRISAKADISMLHAITAIFKITPEAWEKWKKA